MKKLALTLAAVLALGVVAAAPADARDTSWCPECRSGR